MNRILSTFCLLLVLSAIRAHAAFGDPDLAFGTSGARTDTALDYIPMAMARQSDGKIVVVGKRYDSYFNVVELVVRRYNSNGSVDTAFGSSGSAIPYQTSGWGTDVAIQSDGKIVVIGIAPPGDMNNGTTAVWRFRSDGWYDSSFGSFGRVLTWGTGWCDVGLYVVSGGRITSTEVIGACIGGQIFRLTANGTPNQTFGTGGMTQASPTLFSMAIRAGKIYVTIGATIRRYFMDGTLDASFGNQGIFNEQADYSCIPLYFTIASYRAIGFQSNGRIVAAGDADFLMGDLDYYARHLSAHEPNGSFVWGFSSLPCPGTTDIGDGSLFPHVAVQSDDRILIAAGHIVERRASDGLYEASYSTSTSNVVTDILIQPDGRILTVEVVSSGGVDRARLVRRLP